MGCHPVAVVFFTCIQNMKLVTNKFKSGGLHEKHVVATWNFGNYLSICLQTQENQEKPVSRWPVAGPSEYWLLASSPASQVKNSNTHIIQQIHLRWQEINIKHNTILLFSFRKLLPIMRCSFNTLTYAHNDFLKTDLLENLNINVRKNSLETYVSH